MINSFEKEKRQKLTSGKTGRRPVSSEIRPVSLELFILGEM